MQSPIQTSKRTSLVRFLPFIAAGIVLGVWLVYTPKGLLGKADAIAYAVCHRIASHSLFLRERQIPLCARCTGMYTGALIGMIYQLRYGQHRGGMPGRRIAILLGIFFLAFAVDGTNSYLQLFPMFNPLYPSRNWLRLVTGTGMGLVLSAVLAPVYNQTMWRDWSDTPILNTWKQMGILLLVSGAADLAFLSGNPLLLYPLALASAATVLALLGMIYAIVWVLITKKDNLFLKTSQVTGFLVGGFATALGQIGIMDLVRYIFTGSWSGF